MTLCGLSYKILLLACDVTFDGRFWHSYHVQAHVSVDLVDSAVCWKTLSDSLGSESKERAQHTAEQDVVVRVLPLTDPCCLVEAGTCGHVGRKGVMARRVSLVPLGTKNTMGLNKRYKQTF